jgi:peroxiredoxin
MRACIRYGILIGVILASLVARPAAQAGEPFKPFKLKTLDKQERTLADVLGKKATLVVFFFPTCRYCTVGLPVAQKLYDTYRDRGLSMVWINAVPQEERLIPKWREQHGFTVPVLVGASIRAIEKDYRVVMTPTHYLLDAEGKVLSTHGGFQPGDEKKLEDAILDALKEKQQ